MAEDIKQKIYEFLKNNRDQEFNVKQISERLGISYPTTLKWIEVLRAEGKIKIVDWGNLKLIKFLDKVEG